jgi:aminotransferase
MPYPSNPTGCVMTRKELEEVADLLKDKDIFILSDEIYSELVYYGEHCSLSSFPCIRDKVICINGLSKSHSMTGWRIGFILGPSYFIKHALKVHQYNTTCAAAPSQYAAYEALKNGFDDAAEMREEYHRRRDYSYKRLKDMGMDVELPQGAFYIFPSIKQYGMESFTFALSLLEKAKVGVVPGSAFSEYGEGYIRISYACSMDTLNEAFDRLQKFIDML